MNIWLNEITRAWRASLRRPGFLLLASGVLALGIGASVAVTALIDQVLLRPVPVPQVERLAVIGPLQGNGSGHATAVSPMQYQALDGLEGVVSHGLAQYGPRVNIAGEGAPELVPATYADHGLLPTLGLVPVLGRNFTEQEDSPHGPRAVLLGHGFWQRRYGGARQVLGRTLEVEGSAYTIVGVLPASFDRLTFAGDVVLPLALPPGSRSDGTNYVAVVRLGSTGKLARVAAQADTRLKGLYAGMPAEAQAYWQHVHFGAEPFASWQHAAARPVLALFLASALFVMLIALVNLTNLMLLRSLSRVHEGAVRHALGAPLLRLALPALSEGLLVGMAGGIGGVLAARLGLELLRGTMPVEWIPDGQLRIAAWVCAVALAAAVGGALLSAALGVWRGRATASVEELREGGRSGIGVRGGRLGRALVIAQVALATVLLGEAGLFLHVLYEGARTPLGFASEGILTFELAPVRTRYPDAVAVQNLSERLVERLRSVPGATAATATTNLPADLWSGQFNLGGLHAPGGESFSSQYRGVGPAYFGLFGIPLVEGRAFTRSDVRGGEPVTIVSRSLARRRYGGHALGQLIQRESAGTWSARIVGVADDTRQFGPLEEPPEIVYLPLAQIPEDALATFRSFEPMRFALRGKGDPNDWRDAVRAAVAEVAPDQPAANLRPMRDIVRSTTADLRMELLLVGIFASLALLLAATGMYAVMAVAVTAREREFGVRAALGAAPARLVRLVLRGGLLQISTGLAIGVVTTAALVGASRALLGDIGREGLDPPALAGVCLLLAVTGVLACLWPALRAGQVPPMKALRGE